MKKISEIAKEVGKDKRKVRYQVDKLDDEYKQIVDGTWYVNSKGVEIIKNSMLEEADLSKLLIIQKHITENTGNLFTKLSESYTFLEDEMKKEFLKLRQSVGRLSTEEKKKSELVKENMKLQSKVENFLEIIKLHEQYREEKNILIGELKDTIYKKEDEIKKLEIQVGELKEIINKYENSFFGKFIKK